MSATFETLFGVQFCQYKCGTYIGFSDDEMSSDGQSHKPLEATTGAMSMNVQMKDGQNKKHVLDVVDLYNFHNSHVYYNGEKKAKIRFDSPGVRA